MGVKGLPKECKGCPLIKEDEDGVEWCQDVESKESGEFKCWASRNKG